MVKACTGAENSLGAVVRLVAAGFVLSVAGCGGSADEAGAPEVGAPPAPPIAVSGCNQSSPLTPGVWVEQTLVVGGTARSYGVRAPDGYNASRPYPVVYIFHGCGPNHDNFPPLAFEAGSEAIQVRPRALNSDCWTGHPGPHPVPSPDIAFFDALVPVIERSLCADPARRFATGYSSGAFLSNALGCVRADRVRAIATIAGVSSDADCGGPVAAMIVHGKEDKLVEIAAAETLRDQFAVQNRCDVSQPRQAVAPPPCEAYVGCAAGNPVVWCAMPGGHGREDAFIVPAFWDFFKQF